MLLIAFPLSNTLIAQEKVETKFMRIAGKDNVPQVMQTANVTYKKGDIEVTLVSVVHVAEPEYYRKLNNYFTKFDTVLYELVAPKGVVPIPGKKKESLIAKIQQLMSLVLELEHQMDHVDYTQKNFVHADMSPEEMSEAQKKRGDDQITIMLGVLTDMLRQQNLQAQKPAPLPGEGLDLSTIFSDPTFPSKIKLMMAKQMVTTDTAGLGQTLNTILVTDRNGKCMKVLNKQLVAGNKNIAIFYGAAHMPDFERRLVQDYGMEKTSTEWLSAWDIRIRPLDPVRLLLKLSQQ